MTLDEYLFTRAMPEPNSGCWFYMGALSPQGYPGGNAHIRAFKLAGKQIPPNHELDHLCRMRCCINPDHLEAVTHKENMMRGNTIVAKNKNKVLCVHGHSLADAYTKANGHRTCRTCTLQNKSKRKEHFSAIKARWRKKNAARDRANLYAWKARNRDKLNAKSREAYRKRRDAGPSV